MGSRPKGGGEIATPRSTPCGDNSMPSSDLPAPSTHLHNIGDIVVDPMCGGGSIGLELCHAGMNAVSINGEFDERGVRACMCRVVVVVVMKCGIVTWRTVGGCHVSKPYRIGKQPKTRCRWASVGNNPGTSPRMICTLGAP